MSRVDRCTVCETAYRLLFVPPRGMSDPPDLRSREGIRRNILGLFQRSADVFAEIPKREIGELSCNACSLLNIYKKVSDNDFVLKEKTIYPEIYSPLWKLMNEIGLAYVWKLSNKYLENEPKILHNANGCTTEDSRSSSSESADERNVPHHDDKRVRERSPEEEVHRVGCSCQGSDEGIIPPTEVSTSENTSTDEIRSPENDFSGELHTSEITSEEIFLLVVSSEELKVEDADGNR